MWSSFKSQDGSWDTDEELFSHICHVLENTFTAKCLLELTTNDFDSFHFGGTVGWYLTLNSRWHNRWQLSHGPRPLDVPKVPHNLSLVCHVVYLSSSPINDGTSIITWYCGPVCRGVFNQNMMLSSDRSTWWRIKLFVDTYLSVHFLNNPCQLIWLNIKLLLLYVCAHMLVCIIEDRCLPTWVCRCKHWGRTWVWFCSDWALRPNGRFTKILRAKNSFSGPPEDNVKCWKRCSLQQVNTVCFVRFLNPKVDSAVLKKIKKLRLWVRLLSSAVESSQPGQQYCCSLWHFPWMLYRGYQRMFTCQRVSVVTVFCFSGEHTLRSSPRLRCQRLWLGLKCNAFAVLLCTDSIISEKMYSAVSGVSKYCERLCLYYWTP